MTRKSPKPSRNSSEKHLPEKPLTAREVNEMLRSWPDYWAADAQEAIEELI